MNSDQFMHWLEGLLDGAAADDRDLPWQDVEVIRKKMASVEKPAAVAGKEWPIEREAQIQRALLDNAGGREDMFRRKLPFWQNGANISPKSDPTAVPFESVDDAVEDLKRQYPIAHHNV